MFCLVLLCLCLCLCLLLALSSCAELPARPTISISQATAIEHREQVTLYCDTKDANVAIQWFSNHLPLVLHKRMLLSADGRNLTILTVQRNDSAIYTCKTQGFHQAQSSDPIFLTVNCESLSILPGPPQTPPFWVISFSLTAADTMPR